MTPTGRLSVTSLQNCDWIAGKRPDPRFWFALPPLVQKADVIQLSCSIRDQGIGNRGGKLFLHLFRRGQLGFAAVTPRVELFSAKHELKSLNKTLTAELDDIVRLAERGDIYMIQRVIDGLGGSGRELHVTNFSMDILPPEVVPAKGCFCRYDKYAASATESIVDAGDWGTFGNIGHPRDNGDERYDLDLSWLDFGTLLGYPASMLVNGGGLGGGGDGYRRQGSNSKGEGLIDDDDEDCVMMVADSGIDQYYVHRIHRLGLDMDHGAGRDGESLCSGLFSCCNGRHGNDTSTYFHCNCHHCGDCDDCDLGDD